MAWIETHLHCFLSWEAGSDQLWCKGICSNRAYLSLMPSYCYRKGSLPHPPVCSPRCGPGCELHLHHLMSYLHVCRHLHRCGLHLTHSFWILGSSSDLIWFIARILCTPPRSPERTPCLSSDCPACTSCSSGLCRCPWTSPSSSNAAASHRMRWESCSSNEGTPHRKK